MSVQLSVYLGDDRVPTFENWQSAVRDAGHDLIIDEFSPRDHLGFVPMRLNGQECGFEYFFSEVVAEEIEDIAATVGDRDRLAEFVWHSSEHDGRAAEIAAAVLASISDGIFFDPQSGDWARGPDAFGLVERWHADERLRRAEAAERKWATVTERRCPKCGSRCPEYRAKCWVCGHELGRAS
jgi:hypothetical protein